MTGDWRRAFDVYVAGRNRNIAVDQKREIARRHPILADSADDVTPVGPTDRPVDSRFGVGVPGRLAFHRNAGTWRADAPPGAASVSTREPAHDG